MASAEETTATAGELEELRAKRARLRKEVNALVGPLERMFSGGRVMMLKSARRDGKPDESEVLIHELDELVRKATAPNTEISSLGAENAELEALKLQLEDIIVKIDREHSDSKANFLAIKDRDERSSRQNLWLSIAIALVSLILGWLLSLLGSPASVLRPLVH